MYAASRSPIPFVISDFDAHSTGVADSCDGAHPTPNRSAAPGHVVIQEPSATRIVMPVRCSLRPWQGTPADCGHFVYGRKPFQRKSILGVTTTHKPFEIQDASTLMIAYFM